jgi:sugar phosphate isomerase/epimerase
MRLGGMIFRPETVGELDATVEALDTYGLSAIVGPRRVGTMSDEEAAEYGDRADELDLVIGETHFLENLMTRDEATRAERIERLRTGLRKADLMRSRGVIGFAGSASPIDYIGAPDPHNFTDEFRAELREVVLRALDGLDLSVTKLLFEANPNTFFYGPVEIAEFVNSVDHPLFGVHLDQMNMVSQANYFHTTDLINTTFELLGEHIGGAHLKDVNWDWKYGLLLKFDEVLIGDGVLDYPTMIAQLAKLDPDLPCLCEHLETEAEYAVNFSRVHAIANEAGTPFVRRQPDLSGHRVDA